MKKIISFILVVILMIAMTGTAFAQLECDASVTSDKETYAVGDTVIVYVNTVSLIADKGIITFGGELEYDKDVLTLTKIEGQDNWGEPTFYDVTGIFVFDRGNLTKNAGPVVKLTFQVKDTNKTSSVIKVKNIEIANGAGDRAVEIPSKEVTIKISASQTPGNNTVANNTVGDNSGNTTGGNNNTTGGGTNSGNGSNSGNNGVGTGTNTVVNQVVTPINITASPSNQTAESGSKPNITNNTIANGKLPQTGSSAPLLGVAGGIAVVGIAAFSVYKIRLINQKNK